MKKIVFLVGALIAIAAGYFLSQLTDDEALAQRLCEKGNPYSCWSAGRYEHIRNDGHNHKTLGYYERSCALGLSRSCNVVSGYYWSPNKQHPEDAIDIRLAFEFTQTACEKGYTKSCLNMGYMIRKGIGIEKNFETGVMLYQEMCDKGVALGCFNVAISYANWSAEDNRENFGFIDHDKAIDYFIQACALNYADGCTEAADFLQRGNNTETEEAEAQRLLAKAKTLPKEESTYGKDGPTHSSRLDYIICKAKSLGGAKHACHPHLNVPQYVNG